MDEKRIQAYDLFHFNYARKSVLKTFVQYAIPVVALYVLTDLIYVKPDLLKYAFIIRFCLALFALLSAYLAYKSKKLKHIIYIIIANIIIFGLSVNALILLGDYAPMYFAGISLVALGGFGIYPQKANIFAFTAAIIYAPTFYYVYAHALQFNSINDAIYYYVFSFSVIIMLFLQRRTALANLDEEFQTKWLLAEHIKKQTENFYRGDKQVANKVDASNFAKQIVHDLRAPLGALNLLINKIQLSEDEKTLMTLTKDRIEAITGSLASKYKSRIESKEHFHLQDCIRKIVIEKNISLSQSGKKLNFQNLTHTPLHVFGNENDFLRALSNLINNSIEAICEDGNINIEISDSDTRQFAMIVISDNGKGIPAEILPHIGEPGYSFSKTDGSGIGVFSAKTMIEAWGGRFKIDSSIGRGTFVTIELPKSNHF